MFDHTCYVKYLGLLIWLFTFPYLKELGSPQMWTCQRPFLFTDHLLNCSTKVTPALIPENLTVYLFQKESVFLSLPFIFYFGANFLCVTKHFLQFQSDTFFPYGFWCRTLFNSFENENRLRFRLILHPQPWMHILSREYMMQSTIIFPCVNDIAFLTIAEMSSPHFYF